VSDASASRRGGPSRRGRQIDKGAINAIADQGAQAMTDAWTIKNQAGELLSRFVRDERHDVERALLPIHYDTHRLLTEPPYREQFEQHLEQILDREGWTIVPITLIERSTAS
jgi:hypothetical protein